MMFSLNLLNRRFIALFATFTIAAFGAADPSGYGSGSGYGSSSQSHSNTPSTGGFGSGSTTPSSVTSSSSINVVPEMVPVSKIFFTHGDTNQLDAQYRGGRVSLFVKEVEGKKLVMGADGFMVKEKKRFFRASNIRPTVYDTAMDLLFGAAPVKYKKKQMDGILQRLMRDNVNFKTVTCGHLTRALADTQRDISRKEGWSCTPEVVVTCESRIDSLKNSHNIGVLFQNHKKGDTDERLVRGDCRDGETPVYFSQNNRSLYALKMVKSIFQCEMNVVVQPRRFNRLTNGHIFDVRRVGLDGMRLRFYLDGMRPVDGGMYYGNWNSNHPAKTQIEATFPGTFHQNNRKFMGRFRPNSFLQCVKNTIAARGLDTTWFDDLTDAQIMEKQMRKLQMLNPAEI